MFKATADSEFLCACFDFTNPEFLAWYEERVKKIVRMGVSVIKTDFSEAVPEDVVFYNGMSGREGHNLLTYLYAKNIYTWMKEICDEHGELPMLWGRSGYVGSHTIPAAWAGDSSSDKASHSAILQAGLGMAMSGVSFWGYDLGGFYNTGYIGNEERPNIEDYLSSVQMGLWMPLSRAHGKTPREPWQYGDMALKEVKKWINFRHRLVPYLYHTACQSHQSGIPMIRPLVMEYPKDPIAKTQNLSYMLGDALLISPGFDRDEYELYLPEGRWQDIESKEVYEGMTFVHIENKAFADGGTSLRVFQKEGTSIPLFAQKEVLHVPAQLWKQEDLENCASHSRYFSDELDAQNFYQKEEQMFDIFLCIWYTIFMKKDMFTINKNGLSYGRGYVYSLQYHLVWCTKYRKKVLKDGIDVECKEMLESLAQEYKFQILAMEVMPDHIHLLVDCRPQFYISDMIKIMKGNLARQMFLLHPELKKELWGGHLWNPSYCAVTVSDRSREQILAYIEGQKEKSR